MNLLPSCDGTASRTWSLLSEATMKVLPSKASVDAAPAAAPESSPELDLEEEGRAEEQDPAADRALAQEEVRA